MFVVGGCSLGCTLPSDFVGGAVGVVWGVMYSDEFLFVVGVVWDVLCSTASTVRRWPSAVRTFTTRPCTSGTARDPPCTSWPL